MNKFLSRLGPFKWTLHNLVAHPLSEVIYLIGCGSSPFVRLGNWLHDITVPEHEPEEGRG